MANYVIPPFGSSSTSIHGYLAEALQEGEAWLKTQRPALEWQRVIDALGPSDQSSFLADQSNTGYNKTKRIGRELVASLSNFHYEGEFQVQYNQELYQAAQHLTKRDRVWFQQTQTHQSLRKILQYAVSMGTGYGWQTWDKHMWGRYQGDVRLSALAPDCVTFVQLPADADMQRAYAVIIKEELPINLARRIYGAQNLAFANRLMPDRDSPGWIEKGLRKVQQLMGGSPVFKYTGRDNKGNMSFPTVDIFHAYIMDDSINTGPVPRLMGEPDTNWSYQVPVVGTLIPTGQHSSTGAAETRLANEQDAQLFPLRRYCIFARSVDFPCYDGTSPWWHGQVPLGRWRFGDLPWEALGASLLGDVLTMNNGIESIMRDVEDSSHARLDPPAVYDDTRVSKSWAEAVNPRRAGVRAAADMQQGEIFRVLGAQWQYEVPLWIPDWVRQQEGRMDYLAGTPDLVAIAKAKQVPSESTLEKLLEMAGPLVQDMIRSVEAPQYALGEMRKSLYMQFDTQARYMQLAGPAADTENFQWMPTKVVPAYPDDTPDVRRIKQRLFTTEFKYHLTQSGTNELYRLSTKLFHLQLLKSGFPIDWWTYAKIAQIPNFGPAPVDKAGNEITSVIDRWVAQKHMERELATELQGASAEAVAAGTVAGGGAPPPGGPKAPVGRPPTNQRPARIEQKDNGTRSTVVTS